MTDDDARDGDDDARDGGENGYGENGYCALRFLDAGEDDERDERGERSGGGDEGGKDGGLHFDDWFSIL